MSDTGKPLREPTPRPSGRRFDATALEVAQKIEAMPTDDAGRASEAAPAMHDRAANQHGGMQDRTTNAPSFDPLNPTPAEEADMAAGYSDAWRGRPPSRESIAYAWGRGSAMRDRGDEPDAERHAVERRMGEMMRRARSGH